MTSKEINKQGEGTAKTLQGTVVSIANTDTAKVAVSRYVKHVKYKKFMKKVKSFLVHDAGNTTKVGDTVTIQECKPISKSKHFVIKK